MLQEKIDRREFLKLSGQLAALFGLSSTLVPSLADALTDIAKGRIPVLWLQGQSCSGCSVSLLNTDPLGPYRLLSRYIALQFHQTLSTATGEMAVKVVNDCVKKGGYVLVVEGAVPTRMPKACMFAEEPFADQLTRAATAADAVIAVGACAGFGGIPAAENNPTGAMSVPAFLKTKGIQKPVIVIPGCPAHPDWIVGTIAHVMKFGIPPLDEEGRPKAFFGTTVHDQCQRFYDYERKRFAKTLSDDGCMFKLGCVGTLTRADCTMRLWNSGTNSCTVASAPCIGCASEQFARRADFPFYCKNA